MTKKQFLAKWVQKEYRERKKGIGYGLKKRFSTEEVLELMEAWDVREIEEIIKKYSRRLERDTGQYMNQKMVHK